MCADDTGDITSN